MAIYSTTYIAQIAQFISLGLVILNIQVDPHSVETTLSVLTTVVSGILVLYGRYNAKREVTTLGFYRK